MSDPLHEGGLDHGSRRILVVVVHLTEEFGNTRPAAALLTPADVKVADFSYQNDEIAAMIVRAWTESAVSATGC